MALPNTLVREVEDKMKKSLEVLQHNFSSIRSGRASTGMVENIKVDYYGAQTPIKQMANITIPEPKALLIHPWDVSAIKMIEKAISDSDLGIAPVVDGKGIRLVVPALTRERREELAKIANKVAEDSRVAIRSIRRDANESIKQFEKEKKVAEDESFKLQQEIQKLTDRYIQSVDQSQASKEKEITQG